MGKIRLQENELKLILYFAEQLSTGAETVSTDDLIAKFKLSERECQNALIQLKGAQAFRDVGYSMREGLGCPGIAEVILDHGVIQMAREYEDIQKATAAAKPDFVDQIKTRFHTNPRAAWVIVIIAAAIVLLNLFNQLGDAIERISRWFKPATSSSAPPPSPAPHNPSDSSPDPHPPSPPPDTNFRRTSGSITAWSPGRS